jgi:hypothetical protein
MHTGSWRFPGFCVVDKGVFTMVRYSSVPPQATGVIFCLEPDNYITEATGASMCNSYSIELNTRGCLWDISDLKQ